MECDDAEALSGSEPTVKAVCARCAARARIDAACVRSGVVLITVVTRFARAPIGPHAVQSVTACVAFEDESVIHGAGACHEEAIADALEQRGIALDGRPAA